MKPLYIFQAALSGRYYASRSVKQLSPTHMVVTGKKEDVTEQVEAIVAKRTSQALADTMRVVDDVQYICEKVRRVLNGLCRDGIGVSESVVELNDALAAIAKLKEGR